MDFTDSKYQGFAQRCTQKLINFNEKRLIHFFLILHSIIKMLNYTEDKSGRSISSDVVKHVSDLRCEQ